jgi:hypothetical protein
MDDYIHEEECESLMYELQSYADAHPDFDTKFIDSIQKILDKNKRISLKQHAVLLNIREKIMKTQSYK